MSRPWEGPGLQLSQPKTAIVQGGRKKVHHVYQGNVERVDEFDVITDKLLVRKWRRQTQLGGESDWEYEVGEPGRKASEFLVESTSAPFVVRADTAELFEFRIRNLPHPKEVYQVAVETPTEIVVRTTNKKYFKKLRVGDMLRAGMALDPSSLTWTYGHNTLVVSYIKPQVILEAEKAEAKERASMKCIRT